MFGRNGPKNFIAKCSYGADGKIGSGGDDSLTKVQLLHFFTKFSTSSSIFGHQTFARRRLFMTDIPKWPSWASSNAPSCKHSGRTIRVPRSQTSAFISVRISAKRF